MSRSELVITRYDELRKYCEQGGFEAIINCAAYTNVRMDESSFSDAVLVNSSAVLNLGLVSKEFKISLSMSRLIMFSQVILKLRLAKRQGQNHKTPMAFKCC
jgi:hypothetical protein